MDRRPLIIYHTNCWDGFGAAWAAWKRYGTAADYLPFAYGDAWPDGTAERPVYLLDCSYPSVVLQDVMSDWSKRPAPLIIRDHHKTAAEDILPWFEGLPRRDRAEVDVLFDMRHSGAVLAWHEFHKGVPVPHLLHYVEDRDLWAFALYGSREVSVWLRSFPQTFEEWNRLATIIDEDVLGVVEEGKAILRFHQQQVKAMCAQAQIGRLGGYDIPIVNATLFYSEVGEELLKQYPAAPFAAYYMDRADGKRQWGLRSRPDCDCSIIAKQYGGGGHKNASGFVRDAPTRIEETH